MPPILSTDLSDPGAIPYFLWDEPMTVAELRRRLRSAPRAEQLRLLGKILREARDPDVWRFTTIEQILTDWDALEIHLGRRRGFWNFLLHWWRRHGLVHDR